MKGLSTQLNRTIAQVVAIAAGGTNRPVVQGQGENYQWKPRNQYGIYGCKGARTMSAAQQKRAATKRRNIAKNPRGAR